MLNCTPFLLFDGNCAEAMAFYKKCIGGELTIMKLGDTPMKDPSSALQGHLCTLEKWRHRVFGYRLVTPHTNTKTG